MENYINMLKELYAKVAVWVKNNMYLAIAAAVVVVGGVWYLFINKKTKRRKRRRTVAVTRRAVRYVRKSAAAKSRISKSEFVRRMALGRKRAARLRAQGKK